MIRHQITPPFNHHRNFSLNPAPVVYMYHRHIIGIGYDCRCVVACLVVPAIQLSEAGREVLTEDSTANRNQLV